MFYEMFLTHFSEILKQVNHTLELSWRWSESFYFWRNWEKEYVYRKRSKATDVATLQISANIHNIKQEKTKKKKRQGEEQEIYVVSFYEVVLIQNKLSYFEHKPH